MLASPTNRAHDLSRSIAPAGGRKEDMEKIGKASTSNWALRISWLGYSLHFDSLAALAKWVRDVEAMRNIDRIVAHHEYMWAHS